MKKILITIFALTLTNAAFAQAEQTMYWIGGAGNWSDLAHWSYQSGSQAATQPSSIPTATTNVIIDANSGLTTGTSANRTITLNVSPIIKSLTFVAGSKAIFGSSGGTRILRVVGDITLQSDATIPNSSTLYIAMEPPSGTVSTLTTNGNTLSFYFGKGGEGTTNIVGDNFSSVNLRHIGGTLNFNGTNWVSNNMYVVNDGTVMNMPNLTDFRTNSSTQIGGTATDYTTITTSTSNSQLNLPNVTTFNSGASGSSANIVSSYGLTLPQCTSFAVGGYLVIYDPSFLSLPICPTINVGNSVKFSSTIPLSFPVLQTLNVSGIEEGNANGSLALGASGTVVNTQYWLYQGTLTNADISEFNINYSGTGNGSTTTSGASLYVKGGTHFGKVNFNNANGLGYVGGTSAIAIDKLTFRYQGASITQDFTVDTLIMAPSATYTITNGKTITVTGDLIDTTPDCETFWQIIGGTTATNYATINNSTGHDIALENVQLTRIIATGANAIDAAGIDNGGNTNIVFTAPAPKTIYWVGDAGNDQWHTLQNWARTSGGTDYCMPTQYDDIIFDENSVITGNTITITSNSAYFHDITIRDNCPKAAFTITPSNVNVYIYCYGSWYMKSGVTVIPAVYFMSGDKDETITSNTSTFVNLYFTGIGGWTLQDDLKTIFYNSSNPIWYGAIYYRNGTLNTNSKKVSISVFYGHESGSSYLPSGLPASAAYRKLILGASEITIRGAYDAGWSYGGTWSVTTDTLDAGTSTLIFDPVPTRNSTLTALGQAISESTSTTAATGMLNPTYAASINAMGLTNYYNIVFKGTGTSTITTDNRTTSALIPFTANSVRVENKSTLQFVAKWVTLDTLYAAPMSAVQLPSPSVATANNIHATAQLTVKKSMEIPTDDCDPELSTLSPYNAAYPATVSSTVNINIPNTQMTDVKSTGGGIFTASGIDNGGNDGWIFTARAAKDLYWIGAAGDGKWNTLANWTTHSNGTPDGGCLPSKTDNVHFNQYSVLPADKTIIIDRQGANFNNFIAETGTPAGIIIRQDSVQINSYGNLLQTGENMQFTSNAAAFRLNLLGSATDARLINAVGASFYCMYVNNAAAQWTFLNNMTVSNDLTVNAASSVTLDMDKFSGYRIYHLAGIVNMADSISLSYSIQGSNDNSYSYQMNGACTLNADNVVWSSKAGFSSTSGSRTVNIRNAQITIDGTATDYYGRPHGYWNYSGAGAALNAEGSYIKLTAYLTGFDGQEYGTMETIGNVAGAYYGGSNYITGNLTFQKLILNDSRQISGSNTIDTLLVRPKGVILYLANGSTQTVNDLMQLSGSPCLQNMLRAGTASTEAGASQSSATANINYLNAAGVNDYDQVLVGGIIATGDELRFAGNSSNLGLNSNLVFHGSPGLVGLPESAYCLSIDDEDNFILSAAEFYGTDLSTYKWYKKNAAGVYPATPLAAPSTADEIDVRDFGLDGTYKVEIVYDSTATTACKSVDEITVTYLPPAVTFGENNVTDTTLVYCAADSARTVRYLIEHLLNYSDSTYMQSALYDTIKVYNIDYSGGMNLVLITDTLRNAYEYYFEFVTDGGCTSSIYSRVTVSIDTVPAADAGADQTGNVLVPFTMAANTPAAGQSGLWTVVTGTATISNPSSPTTSVLLASGCKSATLQWTVTNGTCEASDTVKIGAGSAPPMINPHLRSRVAY
ncbi:MAG: hypothetical protein LBR64_03835 [Dysgonamonadaceae bacterium]|jgi:hypothetical protein|nr:hypothetical protein [Dysgonamonadaceae bacterium]